jgi:glycosyltransferase involved in cell wall biosynthesis
MSKRLFVLARHFILNGGSYAGFIEEFAKYASAEGYSVKILCAKTEKNLPENENLPFAEIIRYPVPLINIPLLGSNGDYLFLSYHIKNYFKKIKLNSEDILIANTCAALGAPKHKYVLRVGQPALIFLKNMEIAKKEVSIITRIARSLHYHFQYYLEKKCFENSRAIISPSLATFNHNSSYYGRTEKACFIPHSGVKYGDMQNGRSLKIKGNLLLFVSAGNVEKIRKGVIYLEKALPCIFEKYKDVKLLHVGDKFEWNIPEKYKNRIISVGKVKWKKMKDYYASSKLMVLCSLNEGMANVVFEAMAAGLPIVTSDIDGIDEIILHKNNGYIYKRGDVNGLAGGISYMLEHKEFMKKSGRLLKQKAKKIDYKTFSMRLLRFLESKNKKENINLLSENG